MHPIGENAPDALLHAETLDGAVRDEAGAPAAIGIVINTASAGTLGTPGGLASPRKCWTRRGVAGWLLARRGAGTTGCWHDGVLARRAAGTTG